MAKSKFQNYYTETISRKDIKNAEYNPRIIDETAKKKLKKSLKEHGLVEAIVWNKRTGNIVGGHQRISILDTLEKNQDYDLDVCVVDVDEKEEMKLNVKLNNTSMMGAYDLDMLANLSVENDIDMHDFGFDDFDIDYMFDGDDRFSALMDVEEVEQAKEQIEQVRSLREKGKEHMKDEFNKNFYATLVFRDEKDREEFFKSISVPKYENYITVEQLKRAFNKE